MYLPKIILGDLGVHGVRYINLILLYIMKKTDFKKAYNILMDYFDELSNESRIEADKRLSEVGL